MQAARDCLSSYIDNNLKKAIELLEDIEDVKNTGWELGFIYYKLNIRNALEELRESYRKGSVSSSSMEEEKFVIFLSNLEPNKQKWFTAENQSTPSDITHNYGC